MCLFTKDIKFVRIAQVKRLAERSSLHLPGLLLLYFTELYVLLTLLLVNTTYFPIDLVFHIQIALVDSVTSIPKIEHQILHQNFIVVSFEVFHVLSVGSHCHQKMMLVLLKVHFGNGKVIRHMTIADVGGGSFKVILVDFGKVSLNYL